MSVVDVVPATNKQLTDAVLFENLTVLQLVKISIFFATPRFITVFKGDRCLSLSSTRSIQSSAQSYLIKTRFNIILPSTSRSSKWYFSFRFPNQNPVCTTPLSSTSHLPPPPRPSYDTRLFQLHNL